MKAIYIILLSWVCLCAPVAAQTETDTIDSFSHHMQHLQEVTVTGLTGTTRASHSPAPVSVGCSTYPSGDLFDEYHRCGGASARSISDYDR